MLYPDLDGLLLDLGHVLVPQDFCARAPDLHPDGKVGEPRLGDLRQRRGGGAGIRVELADGGRGSGRPRVRRGLALAGHLPALALTRDFFSCALRNVGLLSGDLAGIFASLDAGGAGRGRGALPPLVAAERALGKRLRAQRAVARVLLPPLGSGLGVAAARGEVGHGVRIHAGTAAFLPTVLDFKEEI